MEVLSSLVQFNKHLLEAMGFRMIERCCLSERYLKSVGRLIPIDHFIACKMYSDTGVAEAQRKGARPSWEAVERL